MQLDNNIIAAYHYGSYVYGTQHENSDRDLILIVKEFKLYNIPDYDITVYTKEEFLKKLYEHEVSALECLYLPAQHVLLPGDFQIEINKETLRSAISSKSSNSWLKAKKKFLVDKDYAPYIGQKSAWHAIRILEFGRQIALYGTITDYGAVNNLLPQILSCKTWEEIDKNFRATYNNKASEFKKIAPKAVKFSP